MDSPDRPTQGRFHLAWRRGAAERHAAKEAAAQQKAELAQRIAADRQAEEVRQASDLQLLSSGGIPSMARQRLTQARESGPEQGTFSSDLSPAEAALLRRNGYRPLGLVAGSAMYHIGNVYAPAYQDCEVIVLSDAYNEATRLAVSRMQQEAAILGAHGVVGVRFKMIRHTWSQKSIEVQLLGTAMAGPGPAPEVPWLSDLSGQDWWALHRAGYDPVGLVYGHCTWFILTTQADEWNRMRFTNSIELRHFSDALRQCRIRANGLVTSMARQLHASGVVGVHLSRQLDEVMLRGIGVNLAGQSTRPSQYSTSGNASYGYVRGLGYDPNMIPAYESEHHNLTLSIIGTAIRLRPDAPKLVRATGNVLSLRDGRFVPRTISSTEATFE